MAAVALAVVLVVAGALAPNGHNTGRTLHMAIVQGGGPRGYTHLQTEEAAAYDLAQGLVRFWLRQALLGRQLPLTADLARTGEGGLALLFGTFAGTHGGAQANLLYHQSLGCQRLAHPSDARPAMHSVNPQCEFRHLFTCMN